MMIDLLPQGPVLGQCIFNGNAMQNANHSTDLGDVAAYKLVNLPLVSVQLSARLMSWGATREGRQGS